MSATDESNIQHELTPSLGRTFSAFWSFEWQLRTTPGKLVRLALGIAFFPLLMFFAIDQQDTYSFVAWIVRFHLFFMVPIYCLSVFGPVIRDEIQADTLGFIITRPAKRFSLVLLKYLCTMIWSQVIILVGGLLFFGIAMIRDLKVDGQMFGLFLLCQALAVLAYGAISSLAGLVSKKYMVLGIIYGTIVEHAISNIPTNIHSLAISHHLRSILANNQWMKDQFTLTAEPVLLSTGWVLLATAFYLFFAALMFNVREFHHSDEMEK